MHFEFRAGVRITAAAVLGAALCTGLGMGGARADRAQTNKQMRHDDHKMDHDHMMASMDSDDRWSGGLPVSPSYPQAAPGTLDMNHWTDFTRRHMSSGDASEMRMSKMDRDMHVSEKMKMEETEELYPVAPSYPEAGPGMVDMYCWNSIRQLSTRPGNAAEVAWIRMYRHMSHRLSTGPLWDDVVPLPAAPNYPDAAPGTLDMDHWKDWRRLKMSPGPAAEMYRPKSVTTVQ